MVELEFAGSAELMKIMLTGKVQCDTKWCPQFVVAGVAFANRGIRIIYTRKDTSFP